MKSENFCSTHQLGVGLLSRLAQVGSYFFAVGGACGTAALLASSSSPSRVRTIACTIVQLPVARFGSERASLASTLRGAPRSHCSSWQPTARDLYISRGSAPSPGRQGQFQNSQYSQGKIC